MGALGIVGGLAIILLWAMPDLPISPQPLIWKFYLIMLVADLALPIYYAVDVGGLPWISARRLASGLAVLVFLFSLFRVIIGAPRNRREIQCLEAYCSLHGRIACHDFSFHFYVGEPLLSGIGGLSEALLEWYLPFLLVVYVVKNQTNVMTVIRIICGIALWVAFEGVIEFRFQHKFVLDVIPPAMLQQFIAQNPYLANMIEPSFRNSMYRAVSTFLTSNSFGEFAAVVFPLGLFFSVHGYGWRERIFGLAVVIAMFAAVVVSGARVGYIGMLVALAAFTVMWTIREQRFNKGEIGPIFVTLLSAVGLSALILAVLFVHRVRVYVLGDGEAASSTQSRFLQWSSGWPHILANPITGHGMGSAGELVGYGYNGMVSVDSFPLALLVDFGVPGFVFFSGLIILPIWYGMRSYIADSSRLGALRGAIACSFLAYAFSRLFLAQRENLTMIFTLVAITVVLNYIAAKEGANGDIPAEEPASITAAPRGGRRTRSTWFAPSIRRSTL